MAGLITDLSAIGAIDRTTDVLEIVDVSANGSFKVTPNALVGISGGSVVSTTDSQTIQNKTIDNTNTITLKDTLFTLQDDGDVTKQARFQLSGITTGNTRTYTLPNATGTLADIASAQTFTNKTLTSPVITGGSIDNSTVTVDSVAGHTNANIVTVAGLQISSGVIGANGVATASIADSAVTPAKLLAGTGTGWAWATWSPSYANLTVGNGVVSAKYVQIGKSVFFKYTITLGSTSAIGNTPTISLPVTAISSYIVNDPLGTGYANANTAITFVQVVLGSTTTMIPTVLGATGTFVTVSSALTATVPGTWAAGGLLQLQGNYEAA